MPVALPLAASHACVACTVDVYTVHHSYVNHQPTDESIDLQVLSGHMNAQFTDVKDVVYSDYDTSLRSAIAKMLISWNKT